VAIQDNHFHYPESSTSKLQRKYETKERRLSETVSMERARRKSQKRVESQTERKSSCFELKTP
jgi:predicted translin family RNA/ssDNA-binding protein